MCGLEKSMNNNKMDMQPTITEIKCTFQNIYTAEDPSEPAKIEELSSDVYVPILDDPIDSKEVKKALNDCKEGGYNISRQFFKKPYAIFSHFSHYSLTAFSTYTTL